MRVRVPPPAPLLLNGKSASRLFGALFIGGGRLTALLEFFQQGPLGVGRRFAAVGMIWKFEVHFVRSFAVPPK